jgi:hypothetical protein
LYWFKLVREKNGEAGFVPHLIDDNSGVGTQIVSAPCSDAKYPDVVVGNKRGTFYLEHTVTPVAESVWRAAQPKPMKP